MPEQDAESAPQDRLFVPLMTKHYRDFEGGQKTWELRGVNNQFNPETVVVGRRVELRRGYNTDDSLWGQIVEVETFGRVKHIPRDIARRINPTVGPTEFVKHANQLLSDYDQYIAFKVELE